MAKKIKDKEGQEKVTGETISGLKDELLKKYGGGIIKTMSELEKEPIFTVSTGSLRLDMALKDPFISGISEISGADRAGKTTFSLEAGAQAQKQGME